jgi:carbon-monoxide dehydrogenase medium subunit
LAGRTDLLVQLRTGRIRPEIIVDMKRIPGSVGLRDERDRFVIGASTPG